MADEPKRRAIELLFTMIPKDIRELVGMYAGIWLFILVPVFVFGLVMGVLTYVGNLNKKSKEPDRQCWQLQKIDNQIFKINTCTGETEELKSVLSGTK